ncbi:MAG TPA: NPCBM/NEW2 domain-containing protein [Patescibacteria group bacterium]|nr:NPCBM/NEW2 domain-containing protein [Patescibacteria group bacterium]
MSTTNLPNYIKLACIGIILAGALAGHKAQAAVANWQKGESIVPTSQTDFASDNMQRSLDNLRATGANYVTLVLPYYQNSIHDTAIFAGVNTPTDDALVSAIDYAHSIGLAVNLKVHAEAYDTDWRANINPSNRSEWFTNYGLILNHLGILGQAHRVEMITIGTELIDMASDNLNSTNTANWEKLIATLRTVYSGKLTYSANWGGGTWNDEIDHIKFWSALDYIGVSAYYHVASSQNYTMQSLENAWSKVDVNQLGPLSRRFGKQVIITEVGYRSVQGGLTHPASWTLTGPVDEEEQNDGFAALFNYWNNVPYLAGVQFWDWKPNPNVGGPNDTDFTPQGKLAQKTIASWFTSNKAPDANSDPGNSQTIQLSSLSWASAANGWGPVEINSSNGEKALGDGKTITINGSKYETGLGTNAKSKIIYNISDCSKFTSDIGVDDEVDIRGSVVFQVWSGPNKIYDSGLMTFADPAKHIDLDINGVTNLALIAQDGGNGNGHDHADWANPTITCAAETTPVTPTPPPPPPTPTPAPVARIDVWWPTNGAVVSGIQPFKAMVAEKSISDYDMYWQVDGGELNFMGTSSQDYPHKESMVDLSGWNWHQSGPYKITFVVKDKSGAIIATQSVEISIN